MAKNNFLLVDLNEAKTKKLAETITSDTSRKILNELAGKEEDTEASLAKSLNIPISTVHYHLQKLREAKLIKADEFHYSPKGREVNHYKLANKYIIIAPQKVSGLRQALKNVLPAGLIALGISAVIKLVQSASVFKETGISQALGEGRTMMAEKIVSADAVQAASALPPISPGADIALWFLLGSLATIGIYLIVALVREWWNK